MNDVAVREPSDIEATALNLGETFSLGIFMRITVILNYHPKTAPPGVRGTRIILWLKYLNGHFVCRYWDAFVVRDKESGKLLARPHYHPTAHRDDVHLEITRKNLNPRMTSLETVLAHFCMVRNIIDAVPEERRVVGMRRYANVAQLKAIANYVRAGVALDPVLIDAGTAEVAKAA